MSNNTPLKLKYNKILARFDPSYFTQNVDRLLLPSIRYNIYVLSNVHVYMLAGFDVLS